MSEPWLNDANVSIPVNGSRDTVSFANLLATSLNVEVLVMAFMLRQLTALTAGGKKDSVPCCIYCPILSP